MPRAGCSSRSPRRSCCGRAGRFSAGAGARCSRGHFNMFTLIAIGVGAAYLFSVVAMLAPGLFPHTMRHGGHVAIYFEAAAVIIVLVLLGQVLELRARSRTGSAIRALLDLAPPTARRRPGRRRRRSARSGEGRRRAARGARRQGAGRWRGHRRPLERR